jgi:hypothetical protein
MHWVWECGIFGQFFKRGLGIVVIHTISSFKGPVYGAADSK